MRNAVGDALVEADRWLDACAALRSGFYEKVPRVPSAFTVDRGYLGWQPTENQPLTSNP